MNSKQIATYIGELIYDKDSAIIGYFIGYSTKPTAKSPIQYEMANGDKIIIAKSSSS